MRFIFAIIFLLANLFAVLSIQSYESAGMIVFENPEDISNSILYFILIILFTALVLFLARSQQFLAGLIYFLTLISIFYVLIPFLDIFALFLAIAITVVLIKKPHWLIVNISAFLLSIGISAMFGISLEPMPVIVLLAILAIYDAISVYKTKHMISLADSVTKINAPMVFIIPKGNERMLMGVGDVVIPAILAVSAQKFTTSPEFGFIKLTALFTILGGFIGLSLLLYLIERKKGAHAGLPFINSGAIIGFLLASAIY
ncbi:MAG: presenilin family intramembrane aspartyl protease [Archaeoglobaceae archaeon]|nr:presenilin family intramembrane aspartyl protease [Archaeoglobaceae archaeon]MDW8118017.1 presenilin family intramembrane aspartyl protease PSH [Archaeoglobaceae archaeon]